MAITDLELMKRTLVDLNMQIGEMEQKQGKAAQEFFQTHLSDQLIFRRASRKVVGKSEPEGFLDSLKKPSPFQSRVSEDIAVTLLDDRSASAIEGDGAVLRQVDHSRSSRRELGNHRRRSTRPGASSQCTRRVS
jgi:hypothetical protein